MVVVLPVTWCQATKCQKELLLKEYENFVNNLRILIIFSFMTSRNSGNARSPCGNIYVLLKGFTCQFVCLADLIFKSWAAKPQLFLFNCKLPQSIRLSGV